MFFLLTLGVAAHVAACGFRGELQGSTTETGRGASRLVSVPAPAEPRLDGQGDDTAWKGAPEVQLVALRPLEPSVGASTTVVIRSVHTADRIFFLVSWEDPTEDLMHKPWVWSEAKSSYEEGPQREDMMALAFEHTGTFTGDMLEPADAIWDVWHWKAARTNPQDFAMDKTHRYSREKPEGKANSHTARDGKPIWIARPEDGGDSVERKQPAPSSRGEDLVPQFLPGTPTGSAADVAAKGTWKEGRWTIELSRLLVTGNADDSPFEVGKTLAMGIATFDRTGEMDKATGPVELVLARNAGFFDFERDDLNATPRGFRSDRTGGGPLGKWQIQETSGAPSGRKVVAQVDPDDTDDRYPLLLNEKAAPADVEVTVRFKALAGEVDQAGGLVVRARDKDNYYVVRANALEDNVRLYKVVDGKRKQFAGVATKVSPGAWHTLGLRARGSKFEVFFDGAFLFDAQDETFREGGMVGLWTKADSVTQFDDLMVVDG